MELMGEVSSIFFTIFMIFTALSCINKKVLRVFGIIYALWVALVFLYMLAGYVIMQIRFEAKDIIPIISFISWGLIPLGPYFIIHGLTGNKKIILLGLLFFIPCLFWWDWIFGSLLNALYIIERIIYISFLKEEI